MACCMFVLCLQDVQLYVSVESSISVFVFLSAIARGSSRGVLVLSLLLIPTSRSIRGSCRHHTEPAVGADSTTAHREPYNTQLLCKTITCTVQNSTLWEAILPDSLSPTAECRQREDAHPTSPTQRTTPAPTVLWLVDSRKKMLTRGKLARTDSAAVIAAVQ